LVKMLLRFLFQVIQPKLRVITYLSTGARKELKPMPRFYKMIAWFFVVP